MLALAGAGNKMRANVLSQRCQIVTAATYLAERARAPVILSYELAGLAKFSLASLRA